MPSLFHQSIKISHHSFFNDIYNPVTTGLHKLFPPYRKLKKSEHLLIFINQVTNLAFSIGSIFSMIYLWREFSSISYIAIYNLVQFPCILIGFLIAGLSPLRLKLRTYRVIGHLFYILNFTFLILVRYDPLSSLLLAGIMLGFGTGFHCVANNSLTYTITKDSDRDVFFALESSITSLIAIVVPPLVGLFLSQNIFFTNIFVKYHFLFLVAIVILFIATILSLKLSPLETPRISIKNLIYPLKNNVWRYVNARCFVDGLHGGIEVVISSLIAFMILKKEVNLGIVNSLLTLVAIIFTAKIGEKLKRKYRLNFGMVGATLLLFSRFVYVFLFSIFGILISAVVDLVGGPMFNIGLVSTLFDAMDRSSGNTNFFEYLTIREVFLALGRVTGCLIFWLSLSIFNGTEHIKMWYLLLGSFPIIYFFLTYRFENLLRSASK